MNLYKLSQNASNPNSNYYKVAIVVAESDMEAATIHPDGISIRINDHWGRDISGKLHVTAIADFTWPEDLSKIRIEQIGTALPSLKKGVVLALL